MHQPLWNEFPIILSNKFNILSLSQKKNKKKVQENEEGYSITRWKNSGSTRINWNKCQLIAIIWIEKERSTLPISEEVKGCAMSKLTALLEAFPSLLLNTPKKKKGWLKSFYFGKMIL